MIRSRKRILVLAVLVCALAIPVAGSARGGGGYYLGEHAPLLAEERNGVLITIHGGGWKGNIGARADILMAAYIGQFTSWGYRVYNLAHRPGRDSLTDTLAAVEAVAKENPGRPLCLFGGSSGGHLVLMAAIERRKLVDCVIDQAGIPDLVKPDTTPGWQSIHELAERIWGREGIRDVSPMQRTRDLRAPVLVIAPDCDPTTSFTRQAKFARKLRRGELLRQYGGDGYDTGHCEITWGSIDAGWVAMRGFLDRYAN